MSDDHPWQMFYKVGGWCAVLLVLAGLAEIGITALPGGYRQVETVFDWYALLQENWFLGLRNLGLINILMVALGIPITFALYGAHRRANQPFALFAMLVSFLGVAIFYATNRALALLDLSNAYAAASSAEQRALFAAAGQALLAVGESHVPGTYLAFFFSGLGSILMSLVMLQGGVFSRGVALTGLVGFGFLFLYEIPGAFMPAYQNQALFLALPGGLLTMAWYILVARRLFQLGRGMD